MELIKVIIRTANGLIVSGELTPETIKELRTKNDVSIKKSVKK